MRNNFVILSFALLFHISSTAFSANPSASFNYTQGIKNFLKGNDEAALVYFKKALSENQNTKKTHRFLTKIYIRKINNLIEKNSLPEARRLLKEAQPLLPDSEILNELRKKITPKRIKKPPPQKISKPPKKKEPQKFDQLPPIKKVDPNRSLNLRKVVSYALISVVVFGFVIFIIIFSHKRTILVLENKANQLFLKLQEEKTAREKAENKLRMNEEVEKKVQERYKMKLEEEKRIREEERQRPPSFVRTNLPPLPLLNQPSHLSETQNRTNSSSPHVTSQSSSKKESSPVIKTVFPIMPEEEKRTNAELRVLEHHKSNINKTLVDITSPERQKSWDRIQTQIIGLYRTSESDAIEFLENLAHDSNPWTRACIVPALAHIASLECLELIFELHDDQAPEVHRETLKALKTLLQNKSIQLPAVYRTKLEGLIVDETEKGEWIM